MVRQYTISELKRAIKESKDEFKPLVYNDDNEKINNDAYKDMEKGVKDYDGSAKNESKKSEYPYTDNRGMHNLEYDSINDQFKKDQKSRLKGYTSAQNEKLHKSEKAGNAEYNDFDVKDHVKSMSDGKNTAKKIGLTSKFIDGIGDNKTAYTEGKIKRLNFKNTVFVTESHMLSRVPDAYKVEGKKFYMKDKANNEYLVEWHVEDGPKVINESRIANEKNRVMELFNYKRSESGTNGNARLTEDKKITDILNRTRKLIK